MPHFKLRDRHNHLHLKWEPIALLITPWQLDIFLVCKAAYSYFFTWFWLCMCKCLCTLFTAVFILMYIKLLAWRCPGSFLLAAHGLYRLIFMTFLMKHQMRRNYVFMKTCLTFQWIWTLKTNHYCLPFNLKIICLWSQSTFLL